jgi:Fuc2NAc and GlcNAc transferase
MIPDVWLTSVVFLVSAVATGLMRWYALRSNLLDIPNARSSHLWPTPRGGGVAIVFAFLAAVVALASLALLDSRLSGALLGGGGAIALIGYLDDRRPLPAAPRFLVHVLAAVLVVSLIGGIPQHSLAGWALRSTWISWPITVLVLVWAGNLFNFMDGIDGIAGSEGAFIAFAGGWLNAIHGGDPTLTTVLWSLAAACLGFLTWNWPPAKIFMGDVGSGFVGFSLATLGLATSQRGNLPVSVWWILGGAFLTDATVTLISRMVRGERWLEAHRTHVYQRLARRWRGHLPVTGAMLALDFFWLLPWAYLATVFPQHGAWCATGALAPLAVGAILTGAGQREN